MQQILIGKILQKRFQLLAKSEIILYVDPNEKYFFKQHLISIIKSVSFITLVHAIQRNEICNLMGETHKTVFPLNELCSLD